MLDLIINRTCITLARNSNEKYRQINHCVGGAGGGRNRRLSGNHGTHYNIYTDKNGLHKISAGGLKYFLKVFHLTAFSIPISGSSHVNHQS